MGHKGGRGEGNQNKDAADSCGPRSCSCGPGPLRAGLLRVVASPKLLVGILSPPRTALLSARPLVAPSPAVCRRAAQVGSRRRELHCALLDWAAAAGR